MIADVHSLAAETRSSISLVCRALDLPRSTVYARKDRAPSKRAKDNDALDVEIAAIHAEKKGRYGSSRVYRELRRRGRKVNRKRVEARMRHKRLFGRRPRRFRRTTVAAAKQPLYPTCSTGNFCDPCLIKHGLAILRSCGRGKAGCTWPSWSIFAREQSWAGQPVAIAMRPWRADASMSQYPAIRQARA